MRDYDLIERNMQELADRRKYICDMLPAGGVGVEIGVFLGQFSKHILEVAKPKMLYLVDPWDDDKSFPDAVKKERRTKKQMNEMAVKVRQQFGKKKNVKIRRSTSIKFFEKLPKEVGFDFVYIDGDHSYNGVMADLLLAWARLKPGGIIVVDDHDVNIPYWGEPITRAVADFCRHKEIAPKIHPHNQCLLRK